MNKKESIQENIHLQENIHWQEHLHWQENPHLASLFLAPIFLILGVMISAWAYIDYREANSRKKADLQQEATMPYAPEEARRENTTSASRDWLPVLLATKKDSPGLVAMQESRLPLADFFGQPVIIIFGASWCAKCKQEIAALGRLRKLHALDHIQMIVIDISAKDEAKPHHHLSAQVKQADLLYHHDPEGSLQKELDVYQLPTAFLFDSSGGFLARLDNRWGWNSSRTIAMLRGLFQINFSAEDLRIINMTPISAE